MDLSQLQKQIQKFVDENNWDSPPEHRVLDLVSEAGELAKEVLTVTKYGKESLVQNENLTYELGDTLYSLIVVANKFDINLEEALGLVLKKYKNRLKRV